MKSSREEKPRQRECVGCHQVKTIHSNERCDSCRKKDERKELKLCSALGNRLSSAKKLDELMRILKAMEKVGMMRTAKEAVLKLVMPYSGLAPDTQKLIIRDWCNRVKDEDTDAPEWPIHQGSNTEPEPEDDYGMRVATSD